MHSSFAIASAAAGKPVRVWNRSEETPTIIVVPHKKAIYILDNITMGSCKKICAMLMVFVSFTKLKRKTANRSQYHTSGRFSEETASDFRISKRKTPLFPGNVCGRLIETRRRTKEERRRAALFRELPLRTGTFLLIEKPFLQALLSALYYAILLL